MKYKRFCLLLLLLTLILPAINVNGLVETEKAFEFRDKINYGASIFFLVSLNKSDLLEIALIPFGAENFTGNFTLFLFNERPEENHVNQDFTLDPEIFDKAIYYDLGEKPYLNFTADEELIYYIQIVLLDEGPDTFTLESNRDLIRYYLPQIPGYPLSSIALICSLSALVWIMILSRKLRIKP